MVCQVYSFYFEAVGIATVIWIVLINILTQVSFKKTIIIIFYFLIHILFYY